MTNKNILILKNDRAGDFISSVKLISGLNKNNNKLKIYLSSLNYDYNFLTPNCHLEKINLNLNIKDKIKIFLDLFKNNYDEVFILTPKNFYFFLPMIFRKTKFYAIVVNGKKRNRPPLFLRKFLYKTSIRYRNKINNQNIIQSNLSFINSKVNFNTDYLRLNLSNMNYSKYLSDNFVYFQFKKRFFDELDWTIKEFENIINLLSVKYDKVVFSSDIEESKYDEYFDKNYNSINFGKYNLYNKINEKNVIYLKKIDPKNLFVVIKNANKIISPHGLITQISYLLEKKNINLFNFKIQNLHQYHHQKISFSEWYSNMGIKFIFLNNNIEKSLKKISKFI